MNKLIEIQDSLQRLRRSPKAGHYALMSLRIGLGIIFLWFGAMKIAGYDPVFEIINASFPFLATHTGNILLGILETAIGIGLLANIMPHIVNSILVLHMLGTMSVFVLAPEIMFAPHFPILTLSGEFVFKNIALVLGAIVVMFCEEQWHSAHPQ